MTTIPRLPSRYVRRSLVAAAIACCFAPSVSLANPTGATVVNGQVSMNRQGALLTVTNSPGSIINWQAFSIGAGETTRFVQQSAASAVLNRVTGPDASSILGTLQSNGRVFLLNPNGIAIGHGATIDVAGFVASSLNMSDADFLGGRMRFQAGALSNPVTNAGEIRTPAGGRVLLAAPGSVENSGIITSPQGEVILAAGRTVELIDSGMPDVRVELTAPDSRAINLGQVVAQSGHVGIYGSVVRQGGTVNADSAVVGESGRIVLRASRDLALTAGSTTTASGPKGGVVELTATGGTALVEGRVAATGSTANGGAVQVLGENVGLAGSGSIDASGATGGGSVLIGGDRQGSNPLVQNARFTYVGPDAVVKADATGRGTGGTIITWADDTARVHGQLSARGGTEGGNGGFVETSGRHLDVTRGPDVRAPAGRPGTWLLDPVDLEIVAGGAVIENTAAPFFSPLAEGSKVGVDLINSQLNIGSNVEITTTSQGAADGAQAGNITVSAPIVKTAASSETSFIGTSSLTLRAHNDIIIAPGAGISSTGDALHVALLAADFGGNTTGAVTIGAPITTNGGSINVNAAGAIAVNAPLTTTTVGGNTTTAVSLNSTHGAITVAAPVTIDRGNIMLHGSGAVAVSSPLAITSTAGNTFNSVSLTSDNSAVNVVAAVTTGRSQFQASAPNGAVTIAAPVTTTNSSFTSTSKGDFTLTPAATINTGTGSTTITVTDAGAASININAGQPIAIASGSASLGSDNMEILAPIFTGSGSISLRAQNAGRQMDLGTNTAGKLSLTQAELDKLGTTGTLTLGDTSLTGAVTQSAALTGSAPASINVRSAASITQNAGASLTVNGALNVNAPVLTLNASTSASAISLSGTTINAMGGLTSTGAFTLGSATTATLAAPISASQASITATTLNVSGSVTATGDVTLRGNTMDIAGTVTSTGGGIVSAAPQSFTSMTLGPTTGSGLVLDAAEIGRLSTSGVVRLGNTSTTSAITVGAPITRSGGPLALLANGSISQTAGSIITAPSLRLQSSSGAITLTENNAVGTLAGSHSFFNTHQFSNAAPLTVGSVDGANGLSGGPLTLRTDTLTITSPVTNDTVNISPLTAGFAMNLGSKPGGVLGIDAADLAQISGSGTLTFGTPAAGPITVSAAMARTNGSVALSTGATQAVNVNAALSAPSGVTITGGPIGLAGAVSSSSGNVSVTSLAATPLAITAPVTAGDDVAITANTTQPVTVAAVVSAGNNVSITGGSLVSTAAIDGQSGNVTLTADAMNLGAPVGGPSTAGVTLRPATGLTPISLGAPDSAGVLGLGSSDLGNLTAATLNIGSASTGSITVAAPTSFGSIQEVNLTTAATKAVIVNDALSTAGALKITTDDLSIPSGGTVNAAHLNIATVASGRGIDLGTAGFGTTFMGLDAATLGRITLAANGKLSFLAPGASTLQVSQPTSFASIATDLGLTANTLNVSVSGSLSAPGEIALRANTMDIGNNVTSSGGAVISVAPRDFSVTRLGTNTGTGLMLDNVEIGRLTTTGTVRLGDTGTTSSISIEGGVSRSGGALALLSGGGITQNAGATITAPALGLGALGSIALTENNAVDVLAGGNSFSSFSFSNATPLTIGSVDGANGLTGGSLTLRTNTLTAVTQPIAISNVTIAPLTAGTGVDLGSKPGGVLGIDASDLAQIGRDGVGNPLFATLTVGNSNTGPVIVSAVMDRTANGGSLNIVTGAAQSVAVNAALTAPSGVSISGGSMAIASTGSIAAPSGSVSISTPGAAPFAIDGAISAGTNIFLSGATNQAANLNAALTAGSGVQISAGPITIGSAINAGGSIFLSAAAPHAVNVNAPLTAGSSVTIRGSAINTNSSGSITSSGSGVTLTADSMTFGAVVASPTGSMALGPETLFTAISLGGSDAAGVLGLDSTDLGRLSTNALTIGNTSTGPITTGGAVNFGSTPSVVLTTATTRGVTVSHALTTTGSLRIQSDDLAIPSGGGITAANLTIVPASFGRTIDLGTASFGSTSMGIAAADLARIAVGTGTLKFDAPNSTVNVSQPVAFGGSGLTGINATTINVAGALSTPGAIELLANTMDIAAAVSSTGGGDITASRRTFGQMTLGTPSGTELALSAAEVARFATTGALRLGSTSTTSDINVTAPINAGGVGTLVLAASGSSTTGIRQTATSPITASNLRLQTSGIIDLAADNQVATLAGGTGSFSRSYKFTNAAALTIGSVDGVDGLNGGTLILKADNLAINQPITSNTVTLAPRLAGAAVDLGSNPAGTLGIDAAELAQISGFTLNIGDTSTGAITVSASMTRSNGTIGLTTAPTSTVNVNAGLSASSGVTITSGSINVAAPISSDFGSLALTAQAPTTLNIGGALSAPSGDITLVSDVTNITASVAAAEFGTVTLRPFTSAVPVSLGLETAGALSLTQGELDRVSASRLVVGGSAAGPLTVNAPIALTAPRTLSLQSGGDITQTAGSTITAGHQTASEGEAPTSDARLTVNAVGRVTLRESNNTNRFLNGGASGTAGEFDFVNVTPLRLQDVSISAGKIRVTAGNAQGASGLTSAQQTEVAVVTVKGIEDAANTDKGFEKSDSAKKDEEKAAQRKKDDEEEKKTGKRPQQCS